MDHAPPWPEDGSLIRVAIELPLARFVLRVDVELHTPATVIMGPSGGGKTSLLETIAGLRPRARGRIVLGDEVILDSNTGTTLRPEARRVGYVPQDAGLFPHLTALENVRFGARGDGSRVEAALDVLELRHLLQRYPVALSGGEKQRVALARALAINPRVLLLDEPLAALDVALRERVLPYLLRIRDEWQVPLVYVTHNVGEALALGGELVVIRNGTLEAQGPPLALLDSPDVSRATAGGLENLFQGQVVTHDSAGGITVVQLVGGLRISMPFAPTVGPGAKVTIAVRAEDVLLATEPIHHLSARNVFQVRVVAVPRGAGDALVRCIPSDGGPAWLVRLTSSAVHALGLVPDCGAWLAVKSHSVRLV